MRERGGMEGRGREWEGVKSQSVRVSEGGGRDGGKRGGVGGSEESISEGE